MSVTKDGDTGRWMSQIRVTDWTGKTIHKKKRSIIRTGRESKNRSGKEASPPKRKPFNGNVTSSTNPQAASV